MEKKKNQDPDSVFFPLTKKKKSKSFKNLKVECFFWQKKPTHDMLLLTTYFLNNYLKMTNKK